jgi:5-methylthioadenosine/S-adenosylhomocysteine deaminase
LLAHCCWLTENEKDLLEQTGTAIAHCPVSNMKLASGVAPVPECLERGIKVGLGTDGVKENNSLDMFEEMKFASLLQKVHHLDASLMTGEDALKLATIHGARAIGLEDEIGSLEVGKKADIVILNLNRPHLAPHIYGKYENIVANIVFSASGADVDTVLVDGKVIVENKRLTMANEDDLIQEANSAVADLIEKREPFVPENVVMGDIDI